MANINFKVFAEIFALLNYLPKCVFNLFPYILTYLCTLAHKISACFEVYV